MGEVNGASDLYQYSQLPYEKSLRLLELHPGHADEEIEFSFRPTELGDAEDYEAISYAWGDPTHKAQVHCDGQIVVVTQNLKNALLRLRLRDAPRILWADAICINQEDSVEKGNQVKMMDKIYGRATRVCVWLGHATAEMQPAFGLMDEIVNHSSSTNTQGSKLPDPASECCSALGTFFAAPWFCRLWVVQEVYGHPCAVFCGENEVQWEDVISVVKFLVDPKLPSVYPVDLQGLVSALQIDSAGDPATTAMVFDHYYNFNCSDQRDRVYALLSFPPLRDLRPLIEPDYSKTVAEVFEEALVRIFTSSQNLSLISSLEHQGAIDEEGWPSWIPRWDRGRTTQILNYSSGRVHSSVPRLKYRPTILTLGGVRISTISWCGEVVEQAPEVSIDDNTDVDYLARPFQELLSKCLPDVAHLTDPILLCIAMTLTVGLDLDSNCPPLDLTQFRLDFLSYVASILPFLDAASGTMQHLSEFLKREGPAAGDALSFRAIASRGSKNKRFFCTGDRAFGVGPRAAQAGDIVVLFYGSNAPCVLRRKGAHYQFVGECYLHHHMHGEAIDKAANDHSAVEDYELR